MRTCKSNGALGGDQSFEVLECGGLHLVVTEVVPVSGGADNNKKERKKEFLCYSVYLSEGLRRAVWSLVLLVCL